MHDNFTPKRLTVDRMRVLRDMEIDLEIEHKDLRADQERTEQKIRQNRSAYAWVRRGLRLGGTR